MTSKRFPKKLKLGKHYVVSWHYNNKTICKFIQVTKCGYNFLNLDTNKCILKNHVYLSTCEKHSDDTYFWINKNMYVRSCN